MDINSYHSGGTAIQYSSAIKNISIKRENYLQPIFEAVTNALEAIHSSNLEKSGVVSIKLHFSKDNSEKQVFEFITIEDNGVGLNDKNFERLLRFMDDSKGYKNKGSGRFQYLHYFDKTYISSAYTENGKWFTRSLILSKSDEFLSHNAFVFHKETIEVPEQDNLTSVTFTELLFSELKSKFDNLLLSKLKEEIIAHYMLYLCAHKEILPSIVIQEYVDGELVLTDSIIEADIPTPDKTEEVLLPYSQVTSDGKSIERLDKTEPFQLQLFKIDAEQLDEHCFKLTSKHEIREDTEITIKSIAHNTPIDGKKYLFLLSGDYLDDNDGHLRGNFFIPSDDDLLKTGGQENLFGDNQFITREVIAEKTDEKILSICSELSESIDEYQRSIDELRKFYLLDPKDIEGYSKNLNTPLPSILESIYKKKAKQDASLDIKLRNQIAKLDKVVPSKNEKYEKELSEIVEDLISAIPTSNKNSLTRYVARRKMVLELFDKVLKKELEVAQQGGEINESILHNLIFRQGSSDTENSDLWLINEDFLFFSGTSEDHIKDISIDGTNIIRDNLSDEELEYCKKNSENRLAKRPDILLFPAERKCIIIELKKPDVNVSEYLTQINRYASILYNLTKEEYRFDTFYGYLIGENVEVDDIEDNDSDFLPAYNLGYIFRPHKRIKGKFGNNGSNASLYTEILKYSTLLQRAKNRNKIFMTKLGIDTEQ